MLRKVAIIGTSFRFPGSDRETFWQNLQQGRDLVTQADASRWSHDEYLHPDKAHLGTAYTFAAGSLGDISRFDAGFFSISPREAASMDPQQRFLLEMGWELFENAGVKPSRLRGSNCGVYLGVASVDNAYRLTEDMAAIDAGTATGNSSSITANRLSYFYDLRGPSMTVDTACSSSLVAFHQAHKAIQSGDIDQAITGGISLHLHPFGFLIFSKASMLSPTGRCHSFDESGDGYVRSEGAGLFLLKAYDLAVADGDNILAVVAGSAVNTDGRKSSLTLPSADAQADLIRQAYGNAGIHPDQLDYLEAHGTGTAVGDPIETRALGEALGARRSRVLPIGSVKSNMGHLEAASGAAGLMKALYCLQHREVPATIGITTLNPTIPFADLNLQVVTDTLALKPEGELVVGVNSFGFGGANAHVILRSHVAAPAAAQPVENRALPLVLSAKDSDALAQAAGQMAEFLTAGTPPALYDVAYQALYRRDLLPHRLVVIDADRQAMAQALVDFAADPSVSELSSLVESGRAPDQASGPVLVYSGNGSQWQGMGKALLDEPDFSEAVAQIDAIFQPMAGYSLRAELAGDNGEGRYALTEIAQPALFALQVGVTRMLQRRGVQPVAVLGHSVGEVAAGWACGALSLADATHIIYQRSRLQGLTRGTGQMSAVGLPADATLALIEELGLHGRVFIAGENSVKGSTVAGADADLSRFEAVLNERQIFVRRLALDYAFHSPAMDGIAEQVVAALADIKPSAGDIPFYSTVTGQRLCGEGLGAEYWWHNIRKPVLFQQAVQSLVADGLNVFVEVGPHPILRSYVNDALLAEGVEGAVIATLQRNNHSTQLVDRSLARLLIAGVEPQLAHTFPVAGRFVQLPAYPWQGERFVLPVTSETADLLQRKRVHPYLGHGLPHTPLVWENRLDTRLFPTLADHKVGEAVLFPGAGFTELALAAALQFQPGEFVDIEELEIHNPLILGAEGSRKTRVRIDDSDGTLHISSRHHGENEAWVHHVVARSPGEARGVMLEARAPELPAREPDFDRQAHLCLTSAVGLNYGPAYQAVEEGWIDGHRVLARLSVPATIAAELSTLHLHPALLDSAFQLITQLLAGEGRKRGALAFVPVKLGRIAFSRQASTPCLAEVRLVRRSEHSLLADFVLYDSTGAAVISISNARFRGVRLHRDRSEDVKQVATVAVAKPLPGMPAPALAADSLSPALQARLGALANDAMAQRYVDEVEPLLDSLCSSFVQDLVDSHGGALHVPTVVAQAPQAAALLASLLEYGRDDGSLLAEGDTWRLADPGPRPGSQAIWQALFHGYPEHFQLIHSVGQVGLHLPALLRGERDVQHLLPRETSRAGLARHVLGAAGQQALIQALLDTLAQRLDGLAAGQRLRVLEIGLQGQPLAQGLGPVLDFDRIDYHYRSADAEAGELLNAEFAQVHVSVPGDALNAVFDLVLVPGDLAALDSISQGLRQGAAVLADGGQLVLLAQHPARWADFLFGACADWWLALPEQGNLGAQQRPAFWQQELQRHGLACAAPVELAPGMAAGSYVLVAQAAQARAAQPAAQVPAQQWLLVADPQGPEATLSQALQTVLQGAGQGVSLLAADAVETGAVYPGTDHIVLLAGLFGGQGLPGQSDRCLLAARLVHGCEAAGIAPTCWLLTSNAWHPQAGEQPLDAIADAALWGFGRTLANESGACRVRLLDLAANTSAAALLPVLLAADAETEMAVDAQGYRFVPRLRLQSPARPPQVDGEQPVVSLGFDQPGQLRNLRWQVQPPLSAASDQLDIDVQATGLNFRDVMYALGLLSDEAIENGFSGPTLGFEFAGVVRGKGGDVQGDFQPGDRVVGFGPRSFANRLVTQANAVARIPEGMSFEAAATIPSTFFTVFYALQHLARLEPGEKILIHGAAGGVGIAAVQIAKWCGAQIYATAGSDEKRDFLRLLGVEHVFDSRSLAYADEVLAITGGRGVDVVLNSLAGEAINRNFRVLKPFGRFLELGKRDFYQNTKIGLRPFRNNISYFGIDADQLMSERPELTRRLFAQMMDLFNDGTLTPLPYREFDANDVVEAFRYMQQARQIGKIVVTYRTPLQQVAQRTAQVPASLQLDAQGTYLVTGGLGGFGLRTAQWLVSKGARHLVLLGRRGPATEEAQPALRAWREQGIDVRAVACDITDRAQLASVIADIAGRAQPLRGVVHAATVIDDGLIRNLQREQLERVLEPKAMGAQLLHELTRGVALEFFVMFSSATTLFGNPGQANYVAANHWLEALARHRHALGLPATSVLWGAIDDAGFLARNQDIKQALQGRMGGAALQAAEALDNLEGMLLEGRSGLGVLELDWKALSRFLPTAGAPKFSELARLQGGEQEDDSDADDVQRLLAELDDEALTEVFAHMLKQEISEILRLPVARLDASRPLQELGLDSLMSVELVVAVEERFGIRLPVMELSDSSSIDKLTRRIIELLRGTQAVSDSDEQQALAKNTLARHGVELSAQDLAQLDGAASTRLIN
ncbi:type I polyketide synthase [Pseudomonas eucalypticola]|uniref:SDR family NAD(P)-dependent oxidoreductase n=1 Tax=Pseudomonas eucalypticola TaxID=2599595 RepID=A0A7D5DBG8_9PSED|nr:type I polyketide synthase [Pseudomonas eucalypticola]QKZ06101.1 SDR family NAD(P)-dependent oxidoreductase [Pseudomonas eucalypticola]